MTKLYRNNELLFAIAWIGIYVLLFSVADNLSTSIGYDKLITLPVCLVLVFMLWTFIRKNGLEKKMVLYHLLQVKITSSTYH